MVERLHRTIKDRLMSRACASGNHQWMDHLPFVLLGLRSSVRIDAGCSPADLVYGCHLRLPGDLVDPVRVGDVEASPSPEFVARLRSTLAATSPMPVLYHGTKTSRMDPALLSSSHVFLRIDAVKRPLVPPYEGPFLVLRRSAKTFVILRKGKEFTVSCLLYTSPSPRDLSTSRMPSSA